MNDDKANDVWVCCFHGNAKALVWCLTGYFSYNNNWEKNTKSLRQETIFLQIMFTMVYAMN